MKYPVFACFVSDGIAEHRPALPEARTDASVPAILMYGAVRVFCTGRFSKSANPSFLAAVA